MKRKRKITGFVLVFLLLFSFCPLTAFAAGDAGASVSELTLTVSVTGYPADVENGEAQTTLPDGTEVTVKGDNLLNDLLFVVEPLEGKTLAWIESCLKGKGSNIRAYDIYFLDKSGKRYEITEAVSLAFGLKGEYKNPVVYSVTKKGDAKKLETLVDGNQIVFTTEQSSFYALAEKTETEKPETQKPGTPGKPAGSGTTSDKPGSRPVKTEDGTEVFGFVLLLAVSSLFMFRSVSLKSKVIKNQK